MQLDTVRFAGLRIGNFSRKRRQKMLSTKTAVIIITLVLSVDNFGDWATPKKTPTGLFLFLSLQIPLPHSSAKSHEPLSPLLSSNRSFSEVHMRNFIAEASNACVCRRAPVIIL
jgi:hypothetical protein